MAVAPLSSATVAVSFWASGTAADAVSGSRRIVRSALRTTAASRDDRIKASRRGRA